MNKRLTRVESRRLTGKLAAYRNILTQDEDFDWTHILTLLKFKLERTRKCIAGGFSQDRMKIAGDIGQVERLLARVVKDGYFEEISKSFKKRYGNLRMISGKRLPGAPGIPISFKFQKETPGNRERIRKEWSALHAKATKLQHKDLRLAFDKMHRNIWSWWE